MSRAIFRRDEFLTAGLDFGSTALDLADYATTGLRVVTVGPSGIGKTNAGLLIAEQLAAQGWVSVLMDPEGEIEALYGDAVADVDELRLRLVRRDQPFVVIRVRNASEFIPYAQAVMDTVDEQRKPVFLMIDESQIFSASRKRSNNIGEASDLVNDFVQRGRKRALDLYLSAHRFSGSLHRVIFALKNLTFVGRQEDPTAWSSLAPQFRGAGIGFADLAALAPGEFFCFSRRGCEKVVMPMAAALQAVAPKATVVRPALPATFSQWDRALRAIPADRLRALSGPVAPLLGAITGLTSTQLAAGTRALHDELEACAEPDCVAVAHPCSTWCAVHRDFTRCEPCRGAGVCAVCEGYGSEVCADCNFTGTCVTCHGQGYTPRHAGAPLTR